MRRIVFLIIFVLCFLNHNQIKAQKAFVYITMFSDMSSTPVKYKVVFKSKTIYEGEYVDDPRIFTGIFLNIIGLKKKYNETLTFEFESGESIQINTILLMKSKVITITLLSIGKPYIEIFGRYTSIHKLRSTYNKTIDLNQYR